MKLIDLYSFMNENLNPTLKEKQTILSSEKETNIPLDCFENIMENVNRKDVIISNKNLRNTNTKIRVELADEPSATSVTNFEYEAEENENRKEIKLLDAAYLTAFISEFKLLVQNGN